MIISLKKYLQRESKRTKIRFELQLELAWTRLKYFLFNLT